MSNFDIIVIGGGHAGCEAAAIAAKKGAKTALFTHDQRKLAMPSCNPSIGAVGKGTLVREIDALGGIMAQVTDQTSIHCKMLNNSKGAAVWGPRFQIDAELYPQIMLQTLQKIKNLEIIEQAVDDLLIENKIVQGAIAENGQEFLAQAVILTTGTFLGGKIYIGNQIYDAGRMGEKPVIKLAESLKKHGLRTHRLKTGTPARLKALTIDFEKLQQQPGDNPRFAMAFGDKINNLPQVICHITRTNENTHEIIRQNLHLWPTRIHDIKIPSPRYCPSIETKVTRFPEKTSHQIFLEPTTLVTHTIYPSGLNTSLPEEIQRQYLRTIFGLEQVEIAKPGYLIEYDFIDPKSLNYNLENKQIKNLFLAGQINGTTGYEEAAAQGLLAGINAVYAVQKFHKQNDFYTPQEERISENDSKIQQKLSLKNQFSYNKKESLDINLEQQNLVPEQQNCNNSLPTTKSNIQQKLSPNNQNCNNSLPTTKSNIQQKLILPRHLAAIGVMIDDLLIQGVSEPYRMLTSRIEYRLQIRQDNAWRRLFAITQEHDLLSEKQVANWQNYAQKITDCMDFLKKTRINDQNLREKKLFYLYDLLRLSDWNLEKLLTVDENLRQFETKILQQIMIERQYELFITRQSKEIELLKNGLEMVIPEGIDFSELEQISYEMREKLTEFRPYKIKNMQEISGMTPTAMIYLIHYIKNHFYKNKAEN